MSVLGIANGYRNLQRQIGESIFIDPLLKGCSAYCPRLRDVTGFSVTLTLSRQPYTRGFRILV